MKSVPAKPVAKARHVRTGLSISLTALVFVLLWFAHDGNVSRHAMAAALAMVPAVPTLPPIPTATATSVPTLPPVPTATATATTVPTVPTLPPIPTETPTSTPTATTAVPTATFTTTPTKTPTRGPTRTPTKTPLPPGTDGVLELVAGYPKPDLCAISGGAGLTNDSSDSFTITVAGTPVEAYLIWSARYPETDPGDNQVEIKINGGPGIMVSATTLREAPSGWTNRNHHTYMSADLLTDVNFAGLLTGTFTVTASSLNSAGLEDNQGHGVSLIVFYQDTDCLENEVNFFFGLDGFHHRFPPPYGPNSEVVCVDTPVSSEDRLLKARFWVGGAEGTRPNAIWYYTGTGEHPIDLIDNLLGTVLAGPPVTTEPAFVGNAGPQWDDYSNQITVPAGATFACFQIESVDINTVAIDYGTSGVWVALSTELLPGTSNAPPTATATATTTPVTATATPTSVPATATPTITPTGTRPTATPTVTPTGTRPTATPTPTAAPKLDLIIKIEPNPPVPGQPLTFTIEIRNSGNVILRIVKLIVIIPDHTSYRTATALRSAGWQCNGVNAGDTCEYTVGDMAVGDTGAIPFVPTVDQSVLSGSQIVLNVRAVTQDGLALNGATGTDGATAVNRTIMLLPLVLEDK